MEPVCCRSFGDFPWYFGVSGTNRNTGIIMPDTGRTDETRLVRSLVVVFLYPAVTKGNQGSYKNVDLYP